MKKYKLQLIKDSIGIYYLAFDVPKEDISMYIDDLKYLLGEQYSLYQENKFKRDGNDKYHITAFNSMDYNRLIKGNLDFIGWLYKNLDTLEFPIEFKGIGKASNEKSTSYFVVCSSESFNGVRRYFGLSSIDLHITLGFNPTDVFGVDKSTVLDYDKPSDLEIKLMEINNPYQILKNCYGLSNPTQYKIAEYRKTHLLIENDKYKGSVSYDGKNFFLSTHYTK